MCIRISLRVQPGDALPSQSELRNGRAGHYTLSQSFWGIVISHNSRSAPSGFPHQPGDSLGSVRNKWMLKNHICPFFRQARVATTPLL